MLLGYVLWASCGFVPRMRKEEFMDLKEFIKETITSIAEATHELQGELSKIDVIINPPSSHSDVSDRAVDVDDEGSTLRPLVNVDFDVAVTVGKETSGGGKAGLKIASFEVGGKGEHSRATEQISRVSFKIPMTLSPSFSEGENRIRAKEQRRKFSQSLGRSPSSPY